MTTRWVRRRAAKWNIWFVHSSLIVDINKNLSAASEPSRPERAIYHIAWLSDYCISFVNLRDYKQKETSIEREQSKEGDLFYALRLLKF